MNDYIGILGELRKFDTAIAKENICTSY